MSFLTVSGGVRCSRAISPDQNSQGLLPVLLPNRDSLDPGTQLFFCVQGANLGEWRGFTGSGQAGYNWQSANFVFGVEGDINYLGINDTNSINRVLAATGRYQYFRDCAADSQDQRDDAAEFARRAERGNCMNLKTHENVFGR